MNFSTIKDKEIGKFLENILMMTQIKWNLWNLFLLRFSLVTNRVSRINYT